MEPDRWQRIERLYHAALEHEPARRDTYLSEVCGADTTLRREVESLLAHERQAQGFLDQPAIEIAARDLATNPVKLAVGQTLDRYRILAVLGAGGMGIVYTAHDSRLGRTVALKFLPDEFKTDPDALERFDREARALSALNHANICTIYDTGESGGRTFIVMEYVAGQRLDELIGRKGLPLNQALNYAVQIADALAKAHAAGIVHRDLKPGNIMVSEDGQVKLLDFGLAKLTEAARGYKSPDWTNRSETLSMEGTIVGTAAYMSPEQASGKKIDHRSDVFSFGVVFYEMITGRRPFLGENNIATLSAILSNEPDPVSHAAPGTPREVERIISRMLRKEPDRRFQTAADLKVALQEIKEESESGKLAAAVAPLPRQRRFSIALLAVGIPLLIGALVGLWMFRSQDRRDPPSLRVTRLTFDSGLTTSPAISVDGKLVAYASDRSGQNNLDIWEQQVAGGAPVRLTSNPADDSLPDFSPDGSKIAFVSNRDGAGVYLISTLGGEERLVAKTGPSTSRPRFSPDGKLIAYSVGDGFGAARIYLVSATGGPSWRLKVQLPWAAYPVWSPDGKYLLFVGSRDPWGFRGFDWWVAKAEGGDAVKTGVVPEFERRGLKPHEFFTGPSDWSGDRIVFSSRLGDSTNVWQVSLDPKSWQIARPPERLTTGAGQEINASLAADGRLIFATANQHLALWMLPLAANTGKVLGKEQYLVQPGGDSSRPSLSSDGKKLVFASDRSGNADIWMRDMDSGKETALTVTPWAETHPSISPDGSKVLYASREGPDPVIQVLPLETGLAEKLCDNCGTPMGWFPDGARIFYYSFGNPSRYSSIDVRTRQRTGLIHHEKFNLHMLRSFPDGNWLTFFIPRLTEGSCSVFIVPMRNGVPGGESEWIQVANGSGIDTTPWSSPDGGILYFNSKRDGFLCIWAQHLDKVTKRPKGTPFDVAHFHGARHKLREPAFGPGIASDKLVFTMSDTTGNVWTTKLEPRK